MEFIGDHLAVLMFLVLTVIMFVGYPVAFVLGGVALAFGALGILFEVFRPAQFGSLMPRIFGQAVQNPVLIAVPMFVFMGTILEKSGVADELLKALLRGVRRAIEVSVHRDRSSRKEPKSAPCCTGTTYLTNLATRSTGKALNCSHGADREISDRLSRHVRRLGYRRQTVRNPVSPTGAGLRAFALGASWPTRCWKNGAGNGRPST